MKSKLSPRGGSRDHKGFFSFCTWYLLCLDQSKHKRKLHKLIMVQWYNQTLSRWFWPAKVCLQASKISKIYLFRCPAVRVTSWKANFENYSRYSLITISSYQYNTAWPIIFLVLGTCFCCLLISVKVMPHHDRVSCLMIRLTINAIE